MATPVPRLAALFLLVGACSRPAENTPADASAALDGGRPPALDASVADAATPDAARLDASIAADASMPDAAVAGDASTEDAHVPDAAMPDAALPPDAAVSPMSVSYTHLTLPTIYSV